MHGALAFFQWMMNSTFKPHQNVASYYLGDVVIFSPDWERPKVQAAKDTLWDAGEMVNPQKCEIGLEKACSLEYIIERVVVKALATQTKAIQI